MAALAPVNPGVKLSPYLLEVPKTQAAKLRAKGLALDILAKITMVAIVAIVAAVLIVSLGLGAVSGALPFVLLGLAISTPFLAMGAGKLKELAGNGDDWNLNGGFLDRAKIESGVAEKLKAIEGWSEDDVRGYFQARRWSTDQLPIEALRMVNPNQPLCALLPLIARCNFFTENSQDIERRFIQARDKKYEDLQLGWISRNNLSYLREQVGIPMALEAAVVGKILQDPTLQMRSFTEIARTHPRSFDLRIMGRQFDNNDTYLTFKDPKDPAKDDVSKRAVGLWELERDMQRDGLQQILFRA